MKERNGAPKKLPGWAWGGLIGCAIIMSWMGWNRLGPVTAAERARLASKVGGEDVLNIIRSAERIYATRIQIKGSEVHWETLEDFEAISQPVRLNESDRARVTTLLTNPRNYRLPDEGLVSACQPRWGVRLRFMTATDAINVWVCLECDHMLFQRDGDGGGGEAHFEPMKREISALAVRLFPGDAAIAEAARE